MTSQHPEPQPDFGRPRIDRHPDFTLDRPGALIAALPAVLGFTPTNSLVLVSVERGQLGAVLRVDLGPDLIDRLDELVSVAAAAHPDAVIAVIVDESGALCPCCGDRYRRLCAVLADELAEYDIPLWAAHLVDKVAEGGRWHCVDGCGSRGRVDDPESSPVAAAAVLDGRRLYASRADLQAVIAAEDDTRSRSVAAAVEALEAGRRGAPGGDSTERARAAVQDALAAAARVGAGEALSDAEIAVVAQGLTQVRVRDTLYALAVGELAAGAETLWSTLARRLPEHLRVEPLVQLAFCAYARSDGPLAGLSLEAALRIDPRHRMAVLLDTALHAGMRPDQIRKLALTAYRLADDLEVALPPRLEYGQKAG
ncbi:DUF4192 domain-containing protein [Mycobacterium sp. MS1601]|uniref:DUF4192 domain-containing protein n=1 Tax=Mycobacterium sp. MS1601 TaxID=1936029 RepID=UPI0009FA723D|nr:DUF4192 domain-containing protein [Mycobacterium sp. MS1601]